MTEPSEPKEPKEPKEKAHLGYLLTAYLFESLSAAGVKEVEAHLAQCARCRAELETLRRTLGLVEKHFDTGGRTYIFEERRRKRVLEAARRRRPHDPPLNVWGKRGLIAVAALLMCCVLLFATLSSSRQYSPARYGDYNVAEKTAAPAKTIDETGLATTESDPEEDRRSGSKTDKYVRLRPKRKPEPAPNTESPLQPNTPAAPVAAPAPNLAPAPQPTFKVAEEKRLARQKEASPSKFGDSSGVVSGGPNGPGGDIGSGGSGDGNEGEEYRTPEAPRTPAQKDIGQSNVEGMADTYSKAANLSSSVKSRATRAEEKVTTPSEVNIDPAHEATRFPTVQPPSDPAAMPNQDMLIVNGVLNLDKKTMDELKNRETRDIDQKQAQELAQPDTLVSDPMSKDSADIKIPPDVLAKAELGDHFETINPDKSDSHSAFGNPDARTFHSVQGGIEDAGGGGMNGTELDDLIGLGGKASNGAGDSFGHRSGSGRKNIVKEDLAGKKDSKAGDGDAPTFYGYGYNAQPNGKLSPKSPGGYNTQAVDSAERLLRGYRYFHAQNQNLSFRDYARRPSPVPAAALTDDGLDEDDYIERFGTRPFVDCERDHLSTFGLDVDTASYALARSRLRQGQLPDPEAVRVEEFLNYFKQPYAVGGDDAFGVFAEGAPSPFACAGAGAGVEILKIGIKSRDPRADERKPAMLTFCIDTSGSMTRDDRLELVRKALAELVKQLNPEDAVSIVGFNEQAELILPRTQARQKQRILDAIEALSSHGSTNVEAGLNMAYRMADESYSPDAVNRVVLCSDGVANIGAKGPDEMLKLVKLFSGRGIELSTVGFGMGQYNDKMMVRLADNGNGSCHFVDNLAEARKIFTEQLPPHLNVLARDAKAQVDFNPGVVARYRLLGYEKRKIADKDFRNDAIDSGDIAHSTLITVIYEIARKPAAHGALGKIYLRWKDAGYRHLPVVERNYPLGEGVMDGDIQNASPDFRFMACVARFAELLRESPWVRDSSFAAVLEELNSLPPAVLERADCREVVELVRLAQRLSIEKWSKEIRR